MSRLKKIIVAGLLLAATIVLSRFLSIRTPITTIGLSFVPATLAGMLLGPWWSIFVSGLADLIGALLFPSGAFFPGYTLTALITGFIYGIFLANSYKKTAKQVLVRAIFAHLLVVTVCSMGLNTLWTWYLTKKAVLAIVPTRAINAAVMLPVRVLITIALHVGFDKSGIYKKLYHQSLGEPNDYEEGETEENESGETLTFQKIGENTEEEQKLAENTEKTEKNTQKTAKNSENNAKNTKKTSKNSQKTSKKTKSSNAGGGK